MVVILCFCSSGHVEDDFDVISDYYEAAWNRAQPYLIGILTGYFLWKTKGKKIKMHWVSISICDIIV